MTILVAAALAGVLFFQVPCAYAQAEKVRLVKTRVPATYPDLARRSHIVGVVKLRVVIAPTGHVKETTVIGGNPVLVKPAIDAVKQWEFEAAKEETTEVVAITFQP